MKEQGCFDCLCNKKDITISIMTMKTTTKRSKNEKFIRKVLEEGVEAILTIHFSQKNFVYHPLKVFSKPMGALNIRIM